MRTSWGPLMAALCYHDLAPPGERSSWLKLDVEYFESQIVLLKKIAVFVRPDQLLGSGCIAKGRLNLLLTFDDGLVNNFRLALPVLQRHSVPALFFISTWHMESGEPFWFDRLISAIGRYRLTELDLRHLGMEIYRFSLVEGEARWSGIQRLLEDVKKRDEEQDHRMVDLILDGLPGDSQHAAIFHENDRPLNRDEVLAMRNSGLCSFGSHGHRHRILTQLDDDSLLEELQQSRSILENLLREPVVHIAYPNGNADARVRAACRLAGYRYGYTVAPGRVGPATDRFHIPRILVGGFDTPRRVVLKLARSLIALALGLHEICRVEAGMSGFAWHASTYSWSL